MASPPPSVFPAQFSAGQLSPPAKAQRESRVQARESVLRWRRQARGRCQQPPGHLYEKPKVPRSCLGLAGLVEGSHCCALMCCTWDGMFETRQASKQLTLHIYYHGK